jgi:hypothetical protein
MKSNADCGIEHALATVEVQAEELRGASYSVETHVDLYGSAAIQQSCRREHPGPMT